MKKRHIVMALILVTFLLILLCIHDSKNTKSLTCIVDSNFHGLDSKITLQISVKKDKLTNINMIIDSVLPEEYKSQKQALINQLGADGRMQVTSTEQGIRLSTGMNNEYFETLGLNTDSSYSELKEALEFQGYTCK